VASISDREINVALRYLQHTTQGLKARLPLMSIDVVKPENASTYREYRAIGRQVAMVIAQRYSFVTPQRFWTNLWVICPRYSQHSQQACRSSTDRPGRYFINSSVLKYVMPSVKQKYEQQWSTKYDEKSLNSVRATHFV